MGIPALHTVDASEIQRENHMGYPPRRCRLLAKWSAKRQSFLLSEQAAYRALSAWCTVRRDEEFVG